MDTQSSDDRTSAAPKVPRARKPYMQRCKKSVSDYSEDGWRLARSVDELNRGIDIASDMDVYRQQQGGLGRLTGNLCGYGAATRLFHIYHNSTAPIRGYPAKQPWTNPWDLASYIHNAGMRHAEEKTWSHSQRDDYRTTLRRYVDEGHPPIVLVCLGDITKMHYVVVIGYRDRDLLILDWQGACHVLDGEFNDMSYNPIPFMSAYRAIMAHPS